MLFPKEHVVVELLETVEPEESVVEACRRLKLQGYRLALDDFIFDAKFEPLIALADIIKVDFLLSGPEERRDLLGLIRNKSVEFLAEKVETAAEFDEAVELGYTYFQGYFFSKPEVLSRKESSRLQIRLSPADTGGPRIRCRFLRNRRYCKRGRRSNLQAAAIYQYNR